MNRRSSGSSSRTLDGWEEVIGHCFPFDPYLHQVLSLEGNRLELWHAIFQRLLDAEKNLIKVTLAEMISCFHSCSTFQTMPNDKLIPLGTQRWLCGSFCPWNETRRNRFQLRVSKNPSRAFLFSCLPLTGWMQMVLWASATDRQTSWQKPN